MPILEKIALQTSLPAEAVSALVIVTLIIISYIAYKIVSVIATKWANKLTKATKNDWDDSFNSHGVFKKVSMLVPIVIIYFCSTKLFPIDAPILMTILSVCKVSLALISTVILFSFLNAFNEIYSSYEVSSQTPIKSFIQVLKVAVFIVSAIFVISALINQSPWALIKAMGALTAVSMLVFKDSILGFVASIQLAGQKMISIGDWVEMPQYGADGDVIDISLNTIKIQNWDKTISNVPTYAFVSGTFKNWRGMAESDGRRIKRSFNLDVTSFKFCNSELLEKLSKVDILKEYLEGRNKEISDYNKGISQDSVVNGRRLTNVGTFRHYVKQYLRNHPQLNHDMTFLIRQLQPTEKGLPIEIYVFSADKEWISYEDIQADIFDHILTVVPEFDLRLYQSPTGNDFRQFLSE